MIKHINTFLDSPMNWQCSFQNPATPVMEGIIWLHNYIMVFLIIVVVVVFWFLCRSIYLFRDKTEILYDLDDGCLIGNTSQEAFEFNHDPVIETVWTVVPALILISIAIPSFSLLYSMDEIISPTITLKIIGHQWYWSYEFDNVARVDNLFDYVKRSNHRYVDDADRTTYKYFGGKGPQNKFTKLMVELFQKKDDIYDPKSKYMSLIFILAQARKDQFTRWYWIGSKTVLWDVAFPSLRTHSLSVYGKLHNSIAYGVITRFKPEVFKYFQTGYRSAMHSLLPMPLEQQSHLRSIKVNLMSIFKYISYEGRILGSVKWRVSGLHFDSYMVNTNDLKPGNLRLLEVDNRLILPTMTNIRLLVTSADVIHSWAVPSFGIKIDAIPGRLNQIPLYIKCEGFFYGQCSELCGVNHGFMPIVVQAVDYNTFIKWVRLNINPKSLNELLASNWGVEITNFKKKSSNR